MLATETPAGAAWGGSSRHFSPTRSDMHLHRPTPPYVAIARCVAGPGDASGAHGARLLRLAGQGRDTGGGGPLRGDAHTHHAVERTGAPLLFFDFCSVSNRNSVPSDPLKNHAEPASVSAPRIYPYTAYFTLTNGNVSICTTLLPLASASCVSRVSQVPLPTALAPPQGAAPT
jgi:hypothetical protein